MLLLGLPAPACLPIPRAAHPGAPCPQSFFLLPEFLTEDWVRDAKGPNLRHTTYRQPFPPTPSLLPCYNALRKPSPPSVLMLWTSAPRDYLRNFLSMNRVFHWNELWKLQCLLSPYLYPQSVGVLQHLCFQLTLAPLRSSQGFQQGLLRIAPSPWIRGEAWSPLPMTPLVFRWGLFCVSQSPS